MWVRRMNKLTMSVTPRARHILLVCVALSSLVCFFSVWSGSTTTPISPSTHSFHSLPSSFPINRKFILILKVLAYNRLPSLSRCLHSLSSALYTPEDDVHLHVFLDHLPESSSAQINQSHSILSFVDTFAWPHGDKFVHYRTSNAGLQAQWIEAWWPTSENEFAFVVEDDLEVSPLYYSFVKNAILQYYYNLSNYNPSIYGLSLQRPRFVPGKHGNKIDLQGGTQLFLYQLVGTWGQILFPKPWKEFRLWYDEHKAKNLKPYLDGMITTGWYKKLGEKIWTPWFIKFIHAKSYFNIYTNFPRERALSVSHRDPGVNYGKTAGPDSNLISNLPRDFNLMETPPLKSLKWYDFCFREVVPGRIVRHVDELHPLLLSMGRSSVVLLSIFERSEAIVRNLLCHFERLNIVSYIILGGDKAVLEGLARRGHPVVDADIVAGGVLDQKVKSVLLKGYVAKRCVEYGYDTWVIDANMVLRGDETIDQIFKPSADVAVWKKVGIFFARGGSSLSQIWSSHFLDNLGTRNVNFVDVILRGGQVKLEDDEDGKIGIISRDDQGKIGNVNGDVGKKIVYWSEDLSVIELEGKLQQLNLWALDADNSCKAVVCHPS